MRCPTLKELPPAPEGKNGWPWTEESPQLPEKMLDGSEWPKISIVTPNYNYGQFIEETIRSVLLQNYPSLEYIIIDGASDDNSIEIIKKYEPWLAYWISEKDRGQSHAINKGLKIATGEIFNWLNSDDFYSPNSLYNIARTFLNFDVDIVGGRELRFGSEQVEIHNGTVFFDNLAHTVYQGFNVQPCTFFNLSFVKDSGLINENFHYFMDSELYIRYLLLNGQSKIQKIDHIVSNFRLHNNSKTVKDSQIGNMKFTTEAWSIRYSIAKQLDLDQKVLEITKQLFNLIEHDNWCINQPLDTDFYFYHYLVDLIDLLLRQKLGKQARSCFWQLTQLNHFSWSIGFILILLETHLMCFPLRRTLKSILRA